MPSDEHILIGQPDSLAFELESIAPKGEYRGLSVRLGGFELTDGMESVYLPSFCPSLEREIERFENSRWSLFDSETSDEEMFTTLGDDESMERVLAYDLGVLRSLVYYCIRGRQGRFVFQPGPSSRLVTGVDLEPAVVLSRLRDLRHAVCFRRNEV